MNSIEDTGIRRILGRNKRRYARGTEYAGVFLLLTANAKLFQEFFISIGVGLIGGFFLLASLYGLGCWLAGFIDEFWGIWKEENDHSWVVTPMADKLCKDVEEIKMILVEKECSITGRS